MKIPRRAFPAARAKAAAATTLAIGLLLSACSGTDRQGRAGADGGTFVIATSSDADYLFPPLVSSSQGRAVTELLFDHLAEVGDALNVIGDTDFEPRLANSWTWSDDSLSIAFAIDPNARWHDGQPVTAHDVQFTHRLYTDSTLASLSAPLLGNIDSVGVHDSLTAVFYFQRRSPGAFFDAAGQMLILPAHVYGSIPASELTASDLIRNPVGSGRFRFARWIPGSTIEIVSDTANYRGRAHFDRVIWAISSDFNTAVTRFLSGAADFFDAMRPESVTESAKNPNLRVMTYPGFDYGFLMFNLRNKKRQSEPHPLFADVGVRRALTMGIDRNAIVRNVFDSLAFPSLGPMLRAMPITDTTITQIPHDTAAANALLDSLGWKRQADGIRARNGRELAFTVITPSSSKNRSQVAILMQDQFKRIGVRMAIQQLESNAFFRQQMARDFDAAMHTWHLDAAPGNIAQTWGSEAAVPGGTNYGGYSNPVFDQQVDSALAASSLVKARPLFKQAYQTVVNDAPAIWIYELKGVIGIHERIQVTSIRPDAWWAHVADWSIPANERIERDRIPPATY